MAHRLGLILLCLLWGVAVWAHIASADADVRLPQPATTVNSAEAHRTLERVLARREFQPLKKNSVPSPVLKAITRIKDAIAKLFRDMWKGITRIWKSIHHLFPEIPAPKVGSMKWVGGLRHVLPVVLIGAILFLLGVVISKIIAARRHAANASVKDDALDERDPVARRRQEPSFWERSLTQAEALWRDGKEREALQMLQRACLVLLDARGVLRFDDTRANGEVLRELRRQGHSAVQGSLRPVLHAFDKSWYGFLPVSTDEFTRVLESSRHFRSAVLGEG